MWSGFIKNSVAFFWVLIVCIGCKTHHDEKTKVFLASSLSTVADDIRALSKAPVDLMFLNSSAIAQQVLHGAPCDVIILADDKWSAQLVAKDVVRKNVRVVAKNSLVLATFDSAIEKDALQNALRKISAEKKFIMADPDFVPLGVYTKEALTNLGFYDDIIKKSFRAHSARQATMLLKNGAAAVAFLYRSDAQSEGARVVAYVDEALHRPVEYPLLVCKNARADRVEEFERIIFSEEFQTRLLSKGFQPAISPSPPSGERVGVRAN